LPNQFAISTRLLYTCAALFGWLRRCVFGGFSPAPFRARARIGRLGAGRALGQVFAWTRQRVRFVPPLTTVVGTARFRQLNIVECGRSCIGGRLVFCACCWVRWGLVSEFVSGPWAVGVGFGFLWVGGGGVAGDSVARLSGMLSTRYF